MGKVLGTFVINKYALICKTKLKLEGKLELLLNLKALNKKVYA